MERARRVDVVLAVLATAWLSATIARTPSWTVDDAFIVARYADNLVAHGELAFDVGAPDRVEGFTSPLAMAIAVVVRAAGGDPIAATKLLGTLAALACPALVVWLARELRVPAPAGGLAAFVVAVMPEHATHARSGLETEIFVAASLASFAAFARLLRSERASPHPFAALALVTALVRPEGMAVALVLATLALAARRSRRRSLVVALVAWLVAPLAALFALRLWYYGALLPNTFSAKRGPPNVSHAKDLVALLDANVADLLIAAAVLALLARIARVRVPAARASERVVVGAAALVLAIDVAAYVRAEPVMDYARRFAWHGAACLAVFVLAATALAVRSAVAIGRLTVVASGMLALAFGGAVARGIVRLEHDREWIEGSRRAVANMYEPAARWILESTRADAVVAVYPDAGRIPYLTGRRTIDFGRLNDRALALAHDDREVVDVFFARAPDVLVVSQARPDRLYDSGADAIVADPRFSRQYVLARTFGAIGDARLHVYRRAP